MSETPKFKVGDRVRMGDGTPAEVIDVKPDMHGDIVVKKDDENAAFRCSRVRPDFLTIVPALGLFPEQWFNIHPGQASRPYGTASAASDYRRAGCIGVLHLRPDGTTEMLDPNTGEPI